MTITNLNGLHIITSYFQISTSVPSILMDALTTVQTLLDRTHAIVEVVTDWLVINTLAKVTSPSKLLL